jgi:D-alanyl-D-alanine carboxypeptidase
MIHKNVKGPVAPKIGPKRTRKAQTNIQPKHKSEEWITAKAWAILDIEKGALLEGEFPDEPREIASLTKVVTFLAVWGLI